MSAAVVSELDQSLTSVSLSGEFKERANAGQRKGHNITFATCEGGLGIKIIGGIFEPEDDENEDDDRDFGIFIRKILPEGVAASDGRLGEGDQILSVNGHSLEEVTNAEAVNFLRLASSENYVSLTVSRDQLAQEDFNELIHAYTYSTATSNATSVNGSNFTSPTSSPGATLTPLPRDEMPLIPINTHSSSYAYQPSHLEDTSFDSQQTSVTPRQSGIYDRHSPSDTGTSVLTHSGLLMVNDSPSANTRVSKLSSLSPSSKSLRSPDDRQQQRIHSPPDGASSLFSYVPHGGVTQSPVSFHQPPKGGSTNAPTLNPQVRLHIEKLETALQYLGIQPSPDQQKQLRKHLKADNDGTVLYGDFVLIAREMFQKQLDTQKFSVPSKLTPNFKNREIAETPTFMPLPLSPVSLNHNAANSEAAILRREKDLLRSEIARLKGTLRDKETKCIVAEDNGYKLRKEMELLSVDNRSLRSKVHIAEQAQKAARTTEHDYEQVVHLLESELTELRAQPQLSPSSAGISDIQRRLAVLGCQLRKAEVSKKTYEVATNKLLQFAEHVQEKFSSSKSSAAQNVMQQAREVSCAVKALIEVDTLPFGWDEAYTEGGIKHYINHVTQQTSWQHPVTKVQHSNAMPTKPPPPISHHRPIGPLPNAGR